MERNGTGRKREREREAKKGGRNRCYRFGRVCHGDAKKASSDSIVLRCERNCGEEGKRLTSRRSARLANPVQYSIQEDVAQAL